jgi:CHAD domain-containing protein
MAYRFTHEDDSIQSAMRRIAREQIEKAIAEIDEGDLPKAETIHQVRQRCKKLRGLIRLARPSFGGYAEENQRIRDAARLLSGARDDDVLIETFDALMAEGKDVDGREDLAGVRRRLVNRRDESLARSTPDSAPDDTRLDRFREEMSEALKRVDGWQLSGKGFGALEGGLEKTYRRGRKAFRAARKEPSAENVHEWRKLVKYHGHHTKLLSPIWPQVMKARKDEVSRLGDLLGGHHDLTVFADVLAQDFTIAGNPELLETLVRMARERQGELEAEAAGLGTRLFADRPEALVRAWRYRWKAWLREA